MTDRSVKIGAMLIIIGLAIILILWMGVISPNASSRNTWSLLTAALWLQMDWVIIGPSITFGLEEFQMFFLAVNALAVLNAQNFWDIVIYASLGLILIGTISIYAGSK